MQQYSLEESSHQPGFFKIPGYSRYLVSKAGLVLNIRTNRMMAASRNPAGYFNFRLTADSGKVLTWGRHRLLAFVFIKDSRDIDELFVNHKNGIKGDDGLDNLEWVSPTENVEHAGKIGLTTKCSPMSIRIYSTGEVKNFPSIMACARYLGVSKDTVNWRVHNGGERLFLDGLQYRLGHSDRPWETELSLNLYFNLFGLAKIIYVKNVITNQIKIYKKISDFAAEAGISPSTATSWLKRKNQPVCPGFYQLQYGHSLTEWREVLDPELELQNFLKTRRVIVTDVNGNTQFFTSTADCARAHHVSLTCLNYRLKNGAQNFFNGYKYEYSV